MTDTPPGRIRIGYQSPYTLLAVSLANRRRAFRFWFALYQRTHTPHSAKISTNEKKGTPMKAGPITFGKEFDLIEQLILRSRSMNPKDRAFIEDIWKRAAPLTAKQQRWMLHIAQKQQLWKPKP